MNLTLAPGLLEAMIRHSRETLPEEACGLLAGAHGAARRLIPMTNALASATAYEMPPAELISALRRLREAGEELVAIYHSHPSGPGEPSRRDIEGAHYPDAAHVIVSLERPEKPVVRGFRIIDGKALEIELHAIV